MWPPVLALLHTSHVHQSCSSIMCSASVMFISHVHQSCAAHQSCSSVVHISHVLLISHLLLHTAFKKTKYRISEAASV